MNSKRRKVGARPTPDYDYHALQRCRAQKAMKHLDWDALRKRSLQPGGFGEDRVRLWPQLLNVKVTAPHKTEVPNLTPHPDERQIGLDTDRSFVLYPVGENDRDALQSSLHTLLVALFRKRPKLSYFQGYHDIVTVLYLTLPEHLQLPCVEKLSLHRVRDSMGAGLEPVLGLLRVTQNLLRLADPSYAEILERASPLPFFALSNLLTLFSHDVPTLPLIQHIFDYLLCRPPVWVVYLTAAIILARKEEALRLEAEGEEGMIHSLLSSLPALVDGDIDEEEEEPENEDEDPVLPTSLLHRERGLADEGDAKSAEKTNAGSPSDAKTNGTTGPRRRYELRRFGGGGSEVLGVNEGEEEDDVSTDKVYEEEINGEQRDMERRLDAGGPSSLFLSASGTLSPSVSSTLSPSPTPALSPSTSLTLSPSLPPSTPALSLDLLSDEGHSMQDGKGGYADTPEDGAFRPWEVGASDLDTGTALGTEKTNGFALAAGETTIPALGSGEAMRPISGTAEAMIGAAGTREPKGPTSGTGEATSPTPGTVEATSTAPGTVEATSPASGTGEAMSPTLKTSEAESATLGSEDATSASLGIQEPKTPTQESNASDTDHPSKRPLTNTVPPSTITEQHQSEPEYPSSSSSKLEPSTSSAPQLESSESHLGSPPKLKPSIKRQPSKPTLNLPSLLTQADALAERFPPTDAGLYLSSIMGPQSVVYTFSTSPSALPKDDEAEAMVRNPGLVVYPQMPILSAGEDEESGEDEDEKGYVREKGKGRREKGKERIGKKRRRPGGQRTQTTTVVAGAVVVLGVAMAVYGVRRGGGGGEETWRRAAGWVAGGFAGASRGVLEGLQRGG